MVDWGGGAWCEELVDLGEALRTGAEGLGAAVRRRTIFFRKLKSEKTMIIILSKKLSYKKMTMMQMLKNTVNWAKFRQN